MKDHELAKSVRALIQAEQSAKAECQAVMSQYQDAEASDVLRKAIKAKEECIFELNKIFELLNS